VVKSTETMPNSAYQRYARMNLIARSKDDDTNGTSEYSATNKKGTEVERTMKPILPQTRNDPVLPDRVVSLQGGKGAAQGGGCA